MKETKSRISPEKPTKHHPQSKGRIRLPGAKAAVDAYCQVGSETDPQGMYTGRNVTDDTKLERPIQDADDL